jgi:hypothetical protein
MPSIAEYIAVDPESRRYWPRRRLMPLDTLKGIE